MKFLTKLLIFWRNFFFTFLTKPFFFYIWQILFIFAESFFCWLVWQSLTTLFFDKTCVFLPKNYLAKLHLANFIRQNFIWRTSFGETSFGNLHSAKLYLANFIWQNFIWQNLIWRGLAAPILSLAPPGSPLATPMEKHTNTQSNVEKYYIDIPYIYNYDGVILNLLSHCDKSALISHVLLWSKCPVLIAVLKRIISASNIALASGWNKNQ